MDAHPLPRHHHLKYIKFCTTKICTVFVLLMLHAHTAVL